MREVLVKFLQITSQQIPLQSCEDQVSIFIQYVVAKSRIYSYTVTKKSLQSTAIEDTQQAPHC